MLQPLAGLLRLRARPGSHNNSLDSPADAHRTRAPDAWHREHVQDLLQGQVWR
jgi:hypothetical protein